MARADSRLPFAGPLVAAGLLALALSCGDGGDSEAGGFSSPEDLRGSTIGIPSLSDPVVLEARYLLQEVYGLDVRLEGGDVTFVQSPPDSLAGLLREGEIDAAFLAHRAAFQALEDGDLRVLTHVTKEVRAMTGAPVASTVLLTYADVAQQRGAALEETDRMLAASLAYFHANQSPVIDAVAGGEEAGGEFLRWWWERHDLLYGDRSPQAQERLLDLWQAASAVGDIEGYPEIATVLFAGGRTASEAVSEGDRTTISVALLDDPTRRAALYAIEQGIVTSETVDLSVAYLPASALSEAATTKQYNVVEATPLAVPLGVDGGLNFVILSAGVQSLDGTLLFVRDEDG